LILEILPMIEAQAKHLAKNTDLQNELRQYTILECYKYESKIRTLHESGGLRSWIYTVMKHEKVRQERSEPSDSEVQDIYEPYFDYLVEIRKHLTPTENAWIRAYIECNGSYIEIQRRKGIDREMAADRIKYIIEKCKTLKHIL